MIIDFPNLKKFLLTKLQKVDRIDNSEILRCEKNFKGSPMAIYYIDCDKEFNLGLDSYLEKNIAVDYYDNPNYLQWNYYLIFLRQSLPDSETIARIETEDSFARKFIFTYEELKHYFYSTKELQSELPIDVVGEMKDLLTTNNLQQIFTKSVTYVDGIKNIVEGLETTTALEEVNQDAVSEAFKIKRINRIDLNKFPRPYPIITENSSNRSFDIKAANLLFGSNATGKTTFTESIEMLITGDNIRNPGKFLPKGSILGEYTTIAGSRIPDSYQPANKAYYRERNEEWFSLSKKQEDSLSRNFNRYYYFNSDAAYNLSSDEKSYAGYFASIIFGIEYKNILEHLSGYSSRLNVELRRYNKLVQDASDRFTDAEKAKDDSLTQESLVAALDQFSLSCKENGWQGSADKFVDDYASATSYLDLIIEICSEINLSTETEFHAESTKLNNIISSLHILNERKKELQTIVSRQTAILSALLSDHKVLLDAKIFYDNPNSFRILNVKAELTKLSDQIQVLVSINKIVNEIKTIDKTSPVGLSELKQQIENNRKNVGAELPLLQSKYKQLLDSINTVNAVVSEIKLLGKRYVEIDPENGICPLCNFQHTQEELLHRIGSTFLSNHDSTLELAREALIMLERDKEILDKSYADILNIETLIQILDSKMENSAAIKTIFDQFTEVSKTYATLAAEYDTKLGLLNELEKVGCNETSYLEISTRFTNQFDTMNFSMDSKKQYQEKVYSVDEGIGDAEAAIKDSNAFLITIEEEIRNILITSENTELEQIEKRARSIKDCLKYFSTLRKIIIVPSNDNINEIKRKLEKLKILYEELTTLQNKVASTAFIIQSIEKADDERKVSQIIVDRITKALSIIDDINKKYGRSKLLGKFIKQNESEISELFFHLHSPHEFSKIQMIKSGNEVEIKEGDSFDLKKENMDSDEEEVGIKLIKTDGSIVNISEISSGQRSALALSFFLCLNRKASGNFNVILLDDPVNNVDDLNILSFFDYLRILVTEDGRQVIMTTADDKVASLFEQKFAFLEKFDEFKRYDLQPRQRTTEMSINTKE